MRGAGRCGRSGRARASAKSTGGSASRGTPGGTRRGGPAKDSGLARCENMGSVRKVAPSMRTRNVAWPIQVRPRIAAQAPPRRTARAGAAPGRAAAARPTGGAARNGSVTEADAGSEPLLTGRGRSIFSSTVVPSLSGVGSAKRDLHGEDRACRSGRPGILRLEAAQGHRVGDLLDPARSRSGPGTRRRGSAPAAPTASAPRVGLVGFAPRCAAGRRSARVTTRGRRSRRVSPGVHVRGRSPCPRWAPGSASCGAGPRSARPSARRGVAARARAISRSRLRLVEVVGGHDLLARPGARARSRVSSASRTSASASATRAAASREGRAQLVGLELGQERRPCGPTRPRRRSTRTTRPARSRPRRTSPPG